jgi:RNA polymerase-binding transcription factor DksA
MADDAERSELHADIAADLDAVDEALARLDRGTYTTCEVCQAPLPEPLLVADPLRRRCAEHG